MCEEVGDKLVVVPAKACLEIALDSLPTDVCKVLVHDEMIEAPYGQIDAYRFTDGAPRTLGQREKRIGIQLDSLHHRKPLSRKADGREYVQQ